jgi:hypothetical protein
MRHLIFCGNGCFFLCLEVRKSNVFEAVKQAVPTRQAAEFYGIQVISRKSGVTNRMMAEIAVILRTNAVTRPLKKESLIRGNVTVINTLAEFAPMS